MQIQYTSSIFNVYGELDPREKRAFLLHLGYSILEGAILGALSLNEFVFMKLLYAGPFQLGVLLQLVVFVLPLSIFFNNYLARQKNKRKFLLRMALITRLPMLAFAFFPGPDAIDDRLVFFRQAYMLLFLVYYLANPFVLPVVNAILRSNYQPDRFGKLYSYSQSLNMLAMVLSSFIFGKLLDINPNAYRVVFPVLGLLGFLSVYLITRIRIDQLQVPNKASGLIGSFVESLGGMKQTLLNNKPFLHFQAAIMIYGLAYLMNLAIVAIFLGEELKLNYTEIAFYKGIPLVVSILSFPLFGLIFDQTDPRKFSIYSYSCILVFYLLLMVTQLFPDGTRLLSLKIITGLFIGYLFFGIFQASMNLLWGIGSAFFAPPGETARYHAIHLTLTGVRGIAAPFVGTLIYSFLGFTGAFSYGALSMVVAISLLTWSLKRYPKGSPDLVTDS